MKYLNTSIVMSAAALFLVSAYAHAQAPSNQFEVPKQYVSVAEFEGTADAAAPHSIRERQ